MENNINVDKNLKKELVTILKNLTPICNQTAWLKNEIQSIENRELEDSFGLMSDIASALARQWLQKQPELFQANSIETHSLREFIQKCQANTEIIFDPNETIEETTNRILNEMNNFENKPTRSTR
ncbi:MAG TPA: hypothetical protein VHM20_05490 [Gammaproteobacteria bacterium]|nr:hypothetical protein [Gammaproteobacteria bacterium]